MYCILALLSLAISTPAMAQEDGESGADQTQPLELDQCADLSGSDLDKCEKRLKRDARGEVRQARQDSRSVPLLPSQLDPRYASLDEVNPFALEEYRVRYNACNIPQVDSFVLKAAQLKATVVLARFFVDELARGDASVLELGPELLVQLLKVPSDGQAILGEGQALLVSIPKILVTNPMKIGAAQAAVRDAITNTTNAIAEVPQVAKAAAGAFKKK